MSITNQHGNLTISVWQDNRPVTVAATNSDPTANMTVPRKKRDGTVSDYPCPMAITQYNQYMGGVDRNDQLRGYYNVRLKCRKYYKYLFWFMFDLAITNSFILAKLYTNIKIPNLKTFRANLAKELIANYSSRKRLGRPSLQPQVKRFCEAHFPVKGDGKYHRCHYCYKYLGKRHETGWYCKDCGFYLCHTGKENDCFLLFHLHHGPPNNEQ